MPIPITILTGFLGAGKTTILNKIIAQNPDRKFGLIINEFGAEGIDGQLVESSGDEKIVELSNGCVCCVVREDLQAAVNKVVTDTDVDYVIIETSGLAEPMPVAQTFALDDLGGKVALDAIVAIVDAENYFATTQKYQVGVTQIQAADVVLINKINDTSAPTVPQLQKLIKQINPYAAIVLNNQEDLAAELLIETNKWTVDKLSGYQAEEEHTHEDHDHQDGKEHEHFHVDEVVYTTTDPISAEKMNKWILEDFPAQAVRAKGILRLEIFPGQHGLFLFQMVGATRMLVPFVPKRADFNSQKSTVVVIGKELDKEAILTSLSKTRVPTSRDPNP
ncbi:MAG: GTP-binding protein [Candidatus Doudnabacteria bacterium]|nr:GTP-binding protein [Candidatus Doudnabacteria bacterium]